MNDQEASELRSFNEEIREMGIDCKLMNGIDARRLEPLLCRDVAGALHNPSCYHLNPFRLIVGYLDAALRRGGRVKYGVDVKENKVNNDRIERVVTDQGDYHADWVVVAGGQIHLSCSNP